MKLVVASPNSSHICRVICSIICFHLDIIGGWSCATHLPHVLSFLEQFGITPADMEHHYGPCWNYNIEKMFTSLHVQWYIKSTVFVSSPKGIDDFDCNLTPNHDNIIMKSTISIKNRAWTKLQHDIIHTSYGQSRVVSHHEDGKLNGKKRIADLDPCIYSEAEIVGGSSVLASVSSIEVVWLATLCRMELPTKAANLRQLLQRQTWLLLPMTAVVIVD